MRTNIDETYFDYNEILKNIDEVYLSFKKNPHYIKILEHVSFDLGIQYKQLIESEFNIDSKYFLNLIEKNDEIGSPNKKLIDDIFTSPTNFRYIYHALLINSKLEKWFFKKNLKIIEIGGGYGGLCFYIKNIIKNFEIEYSIIDLANANNLQSKYLKDVNVNCDLYSFENIDVVDKNFDLVISNYCLSEIGLANRFSYLNKIVAKCDKEFYVWNSLSFEGLNLDKYVIEEEKPQTNSRGKFNKFLYTL